MMNQPDPVDRSPKARGALRVLLIDDHPVVLRALRTLLELDGHQVTAGDSGSSGVGMFEDALAQGTPFDVVFTDFSMPGMDGREVTRRVKLAHPSTWVVMLTGWGPEVQADDGWKSHVDAILGKPPRLADLRRVMAGALGI